MGGVDLRERQEGADRVVIVDKVTFKKLFQGMLGCDCSRVWSATTSAEARRYVVLLCACVYINGRRGGMWAFVVSLRGEQPTLWVVALQNGRSIGNSNISIDSVPFVSVWFDTSYFFLGDCFLTTLLFSHLCLRSFWPVANNACADFR